MNIMNYPAYHWCIVPGCNNSSIKTPKKLWIQLPMELIMRCTWLKLARRDPRELSAKSRLYFCEDHFDLENDMENYTEYKLMGTVKRIRMKTNCVPSRFDCQDRKYKSTPSEPRSAYSKRQRISTIEDIERTIQNENDITSCSQDLQGVLPDGINKEQCVEVTTAKTSSSENEDKITSSSENGEKITTSLKESARKTPSLTYNTYTIPPKKRRRRRAKRSKMNEFSELVQGASFKPLLMKASIPKPKRPDKKRVHNYDKNEIEKLKQPEYNNGKKEIEELKNLQFNNGKNEIEEENNPLYNNDTKQIQETIKDDHKNDGLIQTINGDKMKKSILHNDHDYFNTLSKSLAKRVYVLDDYNYALIDHDYAINSIQMIVRKRKVSSKKIKTLYPNNFHGKRMYNKVNSKKINKNSDSSENSLTSTFQCYRCLKVFDCKVDFYYHFQEQHVTDDDSTQHQCYVCDKIYYLRTDLLKHISDEHVGNEETDSADSIQTFKCEYCGLEYIYKKHLMLHIRSHLVDNGNSTQNCSKKTNSAYSKSTLKCEHCGLEYTNKKYLMLHMRRKHLVNNGNTDSADSKFILQCEYCDMVYINQKCLLRHISKKHNKKHQGSSGRSSTRCHTQYDDDKHVRSLAQNNLTLYCDYCGKGYLITGHLINHLENRHGFKRSTLKCHYCDMKCHTKFHLFKHIEKHLKEHKESDIQEETPQTQDPFDIQEETVNLQEHQPLEEQQLIDTQEQCIYTQEACEYTQDEWLDTGEETLDIQEEPLDIKPEIFQCSQCPSSFLYEAEMTNHLQIMHGNIYDLYIKKIKIIKRDAKNNENTSNCLIGKQCDKIDGEDQKECEDIYAGCNFGELELEIKKEFINPLEDIDLPDEQQLQLNLMSDLDPEFLEHQYNIKYGTYDTGLGKDFYPQDQIDLENKHLNPEAVSIKVERMESDEECSYFDFDNEDGHCNSQIPLGNFCFNMEIIKCKCCQKTFPNQEALLDHMHELINEKTKLYGYAKQALVWIESKEPKIKLEKKHKKEPKVILNRVHIPNKSSTAQDHNLNNLQFMGSNVIDDKKQEPIDPSVCRHCSKRLPIKIQMSKYDKLCKKCKKIDRYEKCRKRAKANRELKKSKHGSGSGSDIPKPLTLSDEKMLENMHRFFNKTLKKKSFTPNAIVNDLTIKKIQVQEEIVQKTFNIEHNDLFEPETLLLEGNDLLQPLREEDEKILVQAHDPKLCKSCLIPLNEQENTGNNKTLNTLCNKCRASENCNEIRRKSNKKKKSSDNYNDKISKLSDYKLSCQLCKCKFRNKLVLRKHVARSHL